MVLKLVVAVAENLELNQYSAPSKIDNANQSIC
jgi:hypothetical protein